MQIDKELKGKREDMIGSDSKIEMIKKIAFKFFLETGYEATTIRMICKEANIEPPTLYYFFKSKKGLFLEIRNDLEEEYHNQVAELCLENEKTPEDALKKYFKFCVQYTLKDPDKTRFYLRLHLFKPIELKEEIEERIHITINKKRQLYEKYLEACIMSENIEGTVAEVFRKYTNFIDNITFNIIFSAWCPSEEDISKAWDLFYQNYLMEKTYYKK